MYSLSISLASLIADTERLLASSTLARDVDDLSDRDRDREENRRRDSDRREQSDDPSSHQSSGSSSNPSSSSQLPSPPSPTSSVSSIRLRIRTPSPQPAPPPTGALLFSPLSSRDSFPSSNPRPYPPHSLPSIPLLSSSSLTSSPSPTSPAPQSLDITVEYDDPSHRRSSSPSLHLSISPSSPPPPSSPTLSRINHLLTQHGFSPLSPSPAPTSSTLSTLSEVLSEYLKRGRLVQELLARGKDEGKEELVEKQARRIDELLQAQVRAEVEAEERRAEARRRGREHQQEVESLRSKLQQAHHQLQLKEDVVLNLQAEVAGAPRTRPSADTAERDVAMFRRLHGRDPKEGDAADLSELRVIRLYEDRVEEQRREVDFLRREVAEVNGLLKERQAEDEKDAEQSSQAKSQFTDEIRTLRSELRQRDAAYQVEEKQLQTRLREAEARAQDKEAKVQELEKESRRLAAQLELRVDPQQQRELAVKLREAESRVKDLSRQLQHFQALRGQQTSITAETAIALLQQLSQSLGLPDARELPTTVDQLLLVVDAVPGMQSFIREVTDVVLSGRHSGRPSTFASSSTSPDSSAMRDLVLPTLRAWEAQLTQVSSLTELHSRLLSELSRRTHPFHHQLSGTTPIELLFTELADLVSSENRLFTLMYGPVPEARALHDSTIPDYSSLSSVASAAKMLAHFQHLFDVPHINGVYPKMNELYVFASEQRVAMGQLRSLLRLGVGAPTAAVVNAVRERLGGWEEGGMKRLMPGEKDQEEVRRRVEAVERELQADIERPFPAEEKAQPDDGERGGGRLSAAERRELLLVELSELLGASSHAEVPTIVERLLAQLEELRQKEKGWTAHREALDRAKEHAKLLKQLKLALHVDSVSDLLRAAQSLSSSHSAPSSSSSSLPIRIHGTVRAASSPSHSSSSSGAAAELLAQVKLHLDVKRSSEVVPRLKKLLGRLGMYEDVMPSVDRLVTSLYTLLGVREIAHILPAVRRLKGQGDSRQVEDEEDGDEDAEEQREDEEDQGEEEEEDGMQVRIEAGGERGTTVRVSSPIKRQRRGYEPLDEDNEAEDDEHTEEEDGHDRER